MTKLDRAFIRAYSRDRSQVAAPAEEPAAQPIVDAATSPAESVSEVGAAESVAADRDLLDTDSLYGLTQPVSTGVRILRADGPIVAHQAVPAPHADFGHLAASAGDQSVLSSEYEPFAAEVVAEQHSELLADELPPATVIDPVVVSGQRDIDDATRRLDDEPASTVRVYFGDDSLGAAPDGDSQETQHEAEAGPREERYAPPMRPALSLYRGTTWDETWDSEPVDRGGLFGEASDEPPVAMFEVPRFTWPTMCDTLARTAGQLFESLCDALVTAGNDGHNRVVFTSTRRGAGCTTIALAAARRLAGDGHSVVLVDANWRSPQLAARLGLRPQIGWREIIDDRQPVDEALVESHDDRVWLLPLVERATAPSGGFDAAALALHVARLGRHYDLVLVDAGAFDAPPPGTFDLAAHLVNLADVAILVQDMRAAQAADYERLQQTLDRAGLAWWGMVENFVPAA